MLPEPSFRRAVLGLGQGLFRQLAARVPWTGMAAAPTVEAANTSLTYTSLSNVTSMRHEMLKAVAQNLRSWTCKIAR